MSNANFVQIQSGNFRALVRPENLAKVEDKLAKVKPPVHSIPKPSARDRARVFPVYKPGMSTADYVRQFERDNVKLTSTYDLTGSHPLNCQPAAQYDSSVPLCVEDANPDYVPGLDDAPVKPKRVKRDPKAERIAALEVAIKYLLNNAICPENVQVNQIRQLVGWGEK